MPFKDKEKRKECLKRYWQKYYKLNRKKILAKNRAWSKSEKGKELRRQYRRRHVIKIWIDGSCRPNPGKGRIGIAIRETWEEK